MQIIICDDDKGDRDLIRKFVQTHSLDHKIIEFDSAIPLMKHINANNHFDVLFLDMQMPDSNGWDVAEQLKKSGIDIYIAMVTINENYVYDSFDRVDWFTPKPVTEARIHKILENAYEKRFPVVLEFCVDKMPLILAAREIMYVEVKRNDVYLHTSNGVHKVRESLVNINKQFDFPEFVATHQSYIVNLNYYAAINNHQVVLKNGEKIPLSRNKKTPFLNSMREFVIKRKSNV